AGCRTTDRSTQAGASTAYRRPTALDVWLSARPTSDSRDSRRRRGGRLRQHIREAGQKPPGIFAFLMQSLRFGSEAFPLFKRHPLQESPPHGFRPLKEGLCRLLAEPTPSPRLCISAWARPLADQVRLS